MFKSLTVFRIGQAWESPGADAWAEALSRFEFRACGLTERRSAGWVPPRCIEHASLVENVAGQYLMKLMVETRKLPASAVRSVVDERLDRIEAETGRRPRGKAKKELKEQVEHELLPRAFTRKAATLVWLDPQERFLIVGAASAGAVDDIVSEFSASLGERPPLAPISTKTSPAVAMSAWLAQREAPAGFTIDRDCELRQPDENKATVRYARHSLDDDDVAKHVRHGKVPVQLAMTWDGRVSFVLTDEMRIKRVKFIDLGVAADEVQARDTKEDSFDADAVLATGELSRMLTALLEALGGE